MKLYPIGAKFISIFGAEDVVTKPKKNPFGEDDKMYWTDEYGNIFVRGRHEARMVYDGSFWSKTY